MHLHYHLIQYSCLENPTGGGAWKAAVHGVAEGWARRSDFPFTFHFPALEKKMATHSTVLAWRIPGTGEPGGLPSMGSHRVGHNWSTLAAAAAAELISGLPRWGSSVVNNPSANSRDTGLIPGTGRSPGGGNGNPLQYSWLVNAVDRGTWWAVVHRVAKSRCDWARTQELIPSSQTLRPHGPRSSP